MSDIPMPPAPSPTPDEPADRPDAVPGGAATAPPRPPSPAGEVAAQRPPLTRAEARAATTPAHEPPGLLAAPDALDAGSYTAIREPRSDGGLALDGSWHQISPKYVVSQYVQEVAWTVILVAAAAVAWTLFEQTWIWLVLAAILVVTVITMIILPRQARALGYMLRADDIVFRKGILWQRMVAVPYGRMQLVDITQGPLDRAFGVSKLKMVTAAATTGVEIPGLAQPAAEALRDTLIDVAETRRTGL